ncbi:transcriptional regulator NrdR [uncultured Tyzzerella sp.]|uniref:transcriptional regulator NrdR n=1 Tax=uncultured Tyzzerella sp. TaxID=2321398 RepID=UPI002942B22A|nr:transcriptional regulator NrdR [uncultured Tyzzerella sp.]
MRCPFCYNEDTKVIDTRSIEDNTIIKRRRLCEKCNERFNTYEKLDIIPISVVKRDMTREPFDTNKLLKGILLACNKRPIPMNDIEQVVKEIENKIYTTTKKEINSQDIGEIAIEKLKTLDPIAYVRFASVYKEFKDIDSFMEEVRKVFDDKKGL